MKKLLEAATGVARRNQHAAVRPEHVLVAISEDEELWRKCLTPIARHVFAQRVADALAEIPADAGYRGSIGAPPLMPETEALFEPSRWLRQEVGMSLIVKRLGARAAVLETSKLDLLPLKEELRAATRGAAARASVVVHVAHVLWTIADRAWFRHALATVGGDRDRLVAALGDRLAAFEVGAIDVMRFSEHVRSLVEVCHGAPRAHTATSDAFLVEALRDARLALLFANAGVDVARLQRLLEDGV